MSEPVDDNNIAVENISYSALKHNKTKKLFLIIEKIDEDKYKIVNPIGDIVNLPLFMFEKEIVEIKADQVELLLAPKQKAIYTDYFKQLRQSALLKEERKQRELLASNTVKKKSSSRTPSLRSKSTGKGRSSGLRSKDDLVKGKVVAIWKSTKLTFYRHKISPLNDLQKFRVEVTGVGEFEIQKQSFLSDFNDAVISKSYKLDGIFSYDNIPDKALKYKVK